MLLHVLLISTLNTLLHMCGGGHGVATLCGDIVLVHVRMCATCTYKLAACHIVT